MGFWKRLGGAVLDAGIAVAIIKGPRAKPRHVAEELARSVLLGRVKPMKIGDFAVTMARETELVTDDANLCGAMRWHVARNAGAIMRRALE